MPTTNPLHSTSYPHSTQGNHVHNHSVRAVHDLTVLAYTAYKTQNQRIFFLNPQKLYLSDHGEVPELEARDESAGDYPGLLAYGGVDYGSIMGISMSENF